VFNNDAAWPGDRTVHAGTANKNSNGNGGGSSGHGESAHSSPGPSVHASGLYDSAVSGSASQPHQPSSPMAVSGGSSRQGDPMYGHMQGGAASLSSAGGSSLYATPGTTASPGGGGGPSAAIEAVQSLRLGGGGSPGGISQEGNLIYSSSAKFDRDDCVLSGHGDLLGCSSAPPLQGALEAAAQQGSLPNSSLLSLEEEEGSERMPSALTPA
jgi:hypothetical protein